jgi:hypothetical protein
VIEDCCLAPGADRLFDHEAVYLPRTVFQHEADARAAGAAVEKVCAHVGELALLAAEH